MVFNEIMPQALSLMTDVFGNYVVQKVFCIRYQISFDMLVMFNYVSSSFSYF